MNYTFRMIIYLGIKLLLFLSLVMILFSIIMLVFHTDQLLKWLGLTIMGVLSFIIFMFVYLLRKKKCPVPGIDYF